MIRFCLLRVLPILLAAHLFNGASFGGIFYVAGTGSDTNAGTQAAPWRELRTAAARVSAGDSVLIKQGNFLGFDLISKTGTMTAPIVFRVIDFNVAVVPTTDRADNRDTIHLIDCAYVILDGLRTFKANRGGLRVEGGHHVTIRNGTFGNDGYWGIFTGFSDDLLLENNECFGSTNEHGIYVSNSGDRPTVRGNYCHDNRGAGIQLNADLNIQPGDGIISGALIENNVIYNNGVGGGGAINLDGVQDSVVRNNLLFNNHASGIICFQIDGAQGPRGMQILHNTIDMASDGRWPLNFLQTTGSNFVRNNIILGRNIFRDGLRFGSSNDVVNTDSDYNVVNGFTPDDGFTRFSLSQWQAQGREIHSTTGSQAALFPGTSFGSFRLATNSVGIDRGQLLPGVFTDIEGSARISGAAPDLGCYESGPVSVSIEKIGAGVVQLQLRGGPGFTFRLDASEDLKGWSFFQGGIRSNRPAIFYDSTAKTNRFYRAVP